MEKFERYMQELKELHLTLNEYKNLGEAASFKELEFSKQRRKYEEISEMIINCDLKPFNQENELVKTISNIHYKELSSILMEMIVASKAEEKLNLPFMEAMTSTRLNHLKQIHEMLSVFLANEHTVKNDILMKSIIEKQKHETFTYTISDIYATHLFKYYMEDKKGFLKTFKGMLNKKSTILE